MNKNVQIFLKKSVTVVTYCAILPFYVGDSGRHFVQGSQIIFGWSNSAYFKYNKNYGSQEHQTTYSTFGFLYLVLQKIQISVSIIIILYLIVYSCALSYAW